ncbi:MAG: rod shape-determining protein MreD, partial [Rhodobacterales bacterium]|nr:rod shape-determining protein MreD [Rhodobacterales bacterium]
MSASAGHRLDTWIRHATPFAITLLLTLVALVPLHVPGLVRITPMLTLIAIYHWAVLRPDLLPAWSVFFIGVLQDTLTGTPIGVSAVIFLSIYAGIGAQRRFLLGKSFAVLWLGFAVVSFTASLAGWALVSLYHLSLI